MKSLIALACLAVLAGCSTPTTRTADAVNCRRTDLDIVDSVYKRQGSTTVWCARCKERTYRCVSNVEKTRLECRDAVPEDGCR